MSELDKMTKAELLEECAERGITVPDDALKAEILAILEAGEEANEGQGDNEEATAPATDPRRLVLLPPMILRDLGRLVTGPRFRTYVIAAEAAIKGARDEGLYGTAANARALALMSEALDEEGSGHYMPARYKNLFLTILYVVKYHNPAE